MRTKLEAVVGYLAGRDADPSLLDELTNPSSEASRFLEATRTRSRALLEEPSPEQPVAPALVQPKSRQWRERLGWATVGVLALGAAIGLGEIRFRRVEAAMERASIDARSRSEQVEAALARLADLNSSAGASVGTNQVALGRLESSLGQLDGKVQALVNRPSADPTLVEIRDQLTAIARELAASGKSNARQTEDLKSLIHENARLIKILINRSQPLAPVEEAPPRRNP
jgi:hypothetical protein